MTSLIDKLFSLKSDVQLKSLAIAIFGGIALMMCTPIIKNPEATISINQASIISLSIFGIIVVILSDRITTLKISKDKLNITLAELRKDVKETVEVVRTDLKDVSSSLTLPSESEEINKMEKKLTDVESVIEPKAEKESVEDLLQDARSIGQAMGTLREIMKSYREVRK